MREHYFRSFGSRVVLFISLGVAVLVVWPSGFATAQKVCKLQSATAGEIAWHDRILAALRAAAPSAPKGWNVQKESAYIPDYSDSNGKPQVCVGWDKEYFPAMPTLERLYVSEHSKKSSSASSEREIGKKMGDLGKRLGEALRRHDSAQVSAIENQMQALQNHAQTQESQANFAASLQLMGNDEISIPKGKNLLHIPGATFAFRVNGGALLSVQTRNGPSFMTGDRLTLFLGSPIKSVYVKGKLVKDRHWIREKIYNISVVIKGNKAAINELLKGIDLAKLNALISK